MKRIALLVTTLLASLTLAAPTAAAQPDIVNDLRGCADVWLYGGHYYGTTMQCSGVGIIDRALVQDLQGCVKALLTGGSYWGTYLQCDGSGTTPLDPLVQDAAGCAKAILTGGQYWGTYIACQGA